VAYGTPARRFVSASMAARTRTRGQLHHGFAGKFGGLPRRGVRVGAVVAQYRQPVMQKHTDGGIDGFARRSQRHVCVPAGRQADLDHSPGQVIEASERSGALAP
jgi:hypothetical protein